MKRFVLVLLFCLCTFFAISQEYKPFDFENGEWYCEYFTKGGMFGGGHGAVYATDSVKFFCSGDTIINDTVYKKLYYMGYTSSQNVSKTYISGSYGAIRNDTAQKKVWFNAGNTSFFIYDFNVMNGDSICNPIDYSLPVTFNFCGKVLSIDSVNYCNTFYKRYNIENNQSIIEGIGSDKGLFPVKSSPWYSDLLCYNEKNNVDCKPCNMNFSNNIDQTLNGNIIYVNQSDNQLQVSSDYVMASVELVDISGRSIIKINRPKSKSTDIYVNQKGFYIIRVKIDGKIFSKKIIIN